MVDAEPLSDVLEVLGVQAGLGHERTMSLPIAELVGLLRRLSTASAHRHTVRAHPMLSTMQTYAEQMEADSV